MKVRLTLSVNEKALANARRYARKAGKPISRIFEEIFGGDEPQNIKSESQLAAARLLSQLKDSKSIKIKDDKNLLKANVARRFAN